MDYRYSPVTEDVEYWHEETVNATEKVAVREQANIHIMEYISSVYRRINEFMTQSAPTEIAANKTSADDLKMSTS